MGRPGHSRQQEQPSEVKAPKRNPAEDKAPPLDDPAIAGQLADNLRLPESGVALSPEEQNDPEAVWQEAEEKDGFQEERQAELQKVAEFTGDDLVDDPVRLYLSEIGHTPLLSAGEEKNLAREREKGKCLQGIEEELAEANRPCSALDIVLTILRRLHQASALLDAVEIELSLPPLKRLTDRLSRPELMGAIDGELDFRLVNAVGARMQVTPDEARQALVNLSPAAATRGPLAIGG